MFPFPSAKVSLLSHVSNAWSGDPDTQIGISQVKCFHTPRRKLVY